MLTEEDCVTPLNPQQATSDPGTEKSGGSGVVTDVLIPHAPGAWPLVGHVPSLIRNPLRFVTSLAAHGDVVRLRLGPLPVYALTHPALVHQVLVEDARDYARGRIFEKAGPFLGEGLLASSGTEHRRQRRLLQPAFHRDRISASIPVLRQAAERTSASWRPGQTVAVDRAMNELSLTMLTKTLFTADAGARAAAQIERALPVLATGLITRTLMPEWWTKLPTPANRRFDRSVHDMGTAIDEAVRAYRAQGRDHGDVLSMLLSARDQDGEALTDHQIRDQLVGFGLAGVETTGASLAWLFHELGRHPEIEQRLHTELDTALGDRPPRYEDLPALQYTGRVITETLRLHALWMVMRRTRTSVQLADTTLPAGAEILYSAYALHRDPRFFPDPERFDPDRWLPERARRIPKGAFIPFSAGAHKCIGDSLAFTEMTIALAVICRRWRLRPTPGVRVREVARGDVHPNRLPMVAEPRTDRSSMEATGHGGV
ncbi:cytochrome P450 [Streptomyces sp. G1]|uniref:cytochrome P450 n=1 Tax=Streptomyces sp. G1 TaxID=361572 RepID=UPI00202FE25B|nr:cytochrome P450 [Streptomyces sp. G1]MCM1965123.1 cytochrome P450 [Streptomyces sp. G1]